MLHEIKVKTVTSSNFLKGKNFLELLVFEKQNKNKTKYNEVLLMPKINLHLFLLVYRVGINEFIIQVKIYIIQV